MKTVKQTYNLICIRTCDDLTHGSFFQIWLNKKRSETSLKPFELVGMGGSISVEVVAEGIIIKHIIIQIAYIYTMNDRIL